MMGWTFEIARPLALGLAMSIAGLPASGQSLGEALSAAYETSGLLDQNRALLRAADEDVAQAVATLRPIISYALDATWADTQLVDDDLTGGLSVSLSLLLYDFGRTRAQIDAQKETVLATRQALRSIEQQVLLRGVAAFLNVRRQNAFVSLQNNNVRVIGEQLRAARDRFEVGEVTRTDVSIAEARLAAARSGLAAAEGALAQAREEYNAVTGGFPGALSPPGAAPKTAASLNAARAVARERHPDILQAQHQVSATELGVAAARGSLRPSLNATAQVGVDDDGDGTESVAITLSGPIYQGGQLTSLIREAQANRDASRAGLYLAVQNVEQSVGNAWADVGVARATRTASEEEVRASSLALRGAQEEFAVGSRTTLDVLDLEQEQLDAQTNLISAEIDLILAQYQLLSAMGLLTAEHLGLGVARYDPAAYYNVVKNAPTVFVSPQGERLDRVLKSLGKN
ncbi:MAG: TolC family outer membrane protein [Pseudomonadota bacterium]